MGKPKQQTISRFFSPKSPDPTTPPPPPPISATVSYSPSSSATKRSLAQTLTPPPSKKPKPSTPQSLHQKPISNLLEPSSPPPEEPSRTSKHTPLELQVLALKSRHPGLLLAFEVGYRYRFFGPDAATAASVLNIVAHPDHNFLTASIPTFRLNVHVRRLVAAGHKVGVVRQTETAAIKSHGANRLAPFGRELSAIYTRATVEAAEDMGGSGGEEGGNGNYLMCVVERGIGECVAEGGFEVRVGVVAVEISTGEVIHGEFHDNVMRNVLEAVLLSLSPTEILLGEPLTAATEKLLLSYAGPTSNIRVERTSRDCFSDGGALAEVMSLYENIDNETPIVENDTQNANFIKEENHRFGIEGIMTMPELAVQAVALTIRYLKEFGLERILCLGASFRPFSSTIEMTLSANTLQQLEILKNKFDGSVEGSLLQAMNQTFTMFGSRLLKHWVTHPLCDKITISARLDAVSELAESIGSSSSQNIVELEEQRFGNALVCPEVACILSSVLKTLGKSPDIQRGITRIFHRTASAAEFTGVIHAILVSGKQLQKFHVEDDGDIRAPEDKTVKSALLRRLILTASSSTIISQAAKLLSSLNKDAATQGDMLNLFNTSNDQFPEVARGRIAVQMAKEKLDLLIVQYRKQFGMCNLEFVTVSGTTHLIELPSSARVPSNWVKVSSTKKLIRYHPPEVITAMDGLLLAKEELAVACRISWDSFLMAFGKHYAQFQAAVQALAALDCLHSLATLSRDKNYVRPVFVDDDEPGQIHIHLGRHPVLESLLGPNFVPNDTNLHADGEHCQIVTGPNMGGKSCYIRQVALIAIMAQVGSFVPASSATLHVIDGIYTRMGTSDSIQQGTSTFFEELSEASHILENCSSRSLVIIDELGRGTSTHDGVALAYAALHYLLKEKKCMVLFVTHYPKILDIQKEFEGSVGAYHVSYLTSQKPLEITESDAESSVENLDQGVVTFLYKVVRGASDKSFGLNVARLAQLPSSCIARAAVMAAKLEAELRSRVGTHARNLLMGMPEQPEALRNFSEQTDACKVNFEDLTELCHKLFFYIRSALSDDDPANILCSLKEARKLALKMI